ncbi:DUF2388 domain-containing protein [Pseudomonas sp. QE6]|uniref:DUF2388 domain-containing protein n=1 Tax=Pseudomonas sp. QE6 TaxID=3242491 RepID=UPI003529761F
MHTAKLATVLALLAVPVASAMADDFLRDIISSGATTASLYLTFRHDDKLIAAAQDDASTYVASDGAIRGPYLESALTRLRSDNPGLRQRSDMELANAILIRGNDAPAQ